MKATVLHAGGSRGRGAGAPLLDRASPVAQHERGLAVAHPQPVDRP